MQFAESQLFGRTGKRCVKALRDASTRKHTKLLDHEILSLRLFVKLLKGGRPRTITTNLEPPVIIFSDACYEKDSRDLVCGLGAVMIDQSKGARRFFACSLDEQQRQFLGEAQKQQIIFEAETFCVVKCFQSCFGCRLWKVAAVFSMWITRVQNSA